jgi:cobalt/nickel transport system permease protein
MTAGFYDMCHAMRRFGCPKVLVTQLQFTYRYMVVVVEEAVGMDRARKARGFGRNSYPLRMWGRMVGQLLVRSYERATRIYRAMLSRGFDGTMPLSRPQHMSGLSWVFMLIWVAVMLALRLINISQLIF